MIDQQALLAALSGQQPQNAVDPMQALMAVHPAALQHLAGDVVPIPIQPGPMAGKPAPGDWSTAVRESQIPGSNVSRITASPVFQQRLEDRYKNSLGR